MIGNKIAPTAKEYGCRAGNCGVDEDEACSTNTENAILRFASGIGARE
jgi:hypothetical protein